MIRAVKLALSQEVANPMTKMVHCIDHRSQACDYAPFGELLKLSVYVYIRIYICICKYVTQW